MPIFSIGSAGRPKETATPLNIEPEGVVHFVPQASAESPVDYKLLRLYEMSEIWKGTVLEPHTVRLLAMLLVEDGTLTAERRHDCYKGVCYAIGLQGHHICHRGTPLIYVRAGQKQHYFCSWRGKISPQKRFESAYPLFAFDWREQFAEFTLRMTECIDAGKTVNVCVQGWNPQEVGRVAKVKAREYVVLEALGR